MGKKNKKGGRDRVNAPKQSVRHDKWQMDMNNELFEKYYKAQNILPEEEWEAFMTSLRTPLPTTFRVTGSKATAQDLNTFIKTHHLPSLSSVIFEGQPISPPTQLPWYPDGLGWQLNLAKTVLRKSEEFRKFQNFLVYETEVGNISRQEAVSMIPPLLLDVQPHHYVMDMCAAPGSKSAQLLESLHADDPLSHSTIPRGLLIANDSDYKRTHMLVHQASRLASPALMVTNLDASLFPSLKVPVEYVVRGKERDGSTRTLVFDRILADVPCTGDGTLRKNVNIWRDWGVGAGNGMHALQLRILLRAMKLLRPGGRMVYSTCSLNPVENEAVIAAALRQSSSDFTLLDVSPLLPALKRRPGLRAWKVAISKDLVWADTYEAYEEYLKARKEQKRYPPSLWPPENVEELKLERCLRVLPHDQDTGCFFVAVLEKAPPAERTRPVKEVQETENADEARKRKAEDEPDGQPETKRSRPEVEDTEAVTGGAYHEHPFDFIDPSLPLLHECLQSLHLSPTFPSSLLFTRGPIKDILRNVYLTTPIIRSLITSNDPTKFRLINCGVKVFAQHDTGPAAKKFRYVEEGAGLVLPHVGEGGEVVGEVGDLRGLLEEYTVRMEEVSEGLRGVIEPREMGSYFLRIKPTESGEISLRHELVLPLWRAPASIGLLIEKKARSALSLRFFGEDVSPAGQALKNKNGAKTAVAVEAGAEDGGEELGEETGVSEVVEEVVEAETGNADAVDESGAGAEEKMVES